MEKSWLRRNLIIRRRNQQESMEYVVVGNSTMYLEPNIIKKEE
jgi:hypothetical protein